LGNLTERKAIKPGLSERWNGMVCTSRGEQVIVPHAHAGQQKFLECNYPRRLLVCHRRWGKDWATILDIRHRIEQWQNEPHRKQLSPPVSIGIIYPTYPLANEFWSALKRMMPADEVRSANESKPNKMILHCGAEIEVRTGSDPDMLVAAGYDLVVLGEAARLPHESWLTVMPALASPGRAGMAVHQTTPKGQNWIAREANSPDWWVLTVPIYDVTGARHEDANPFLSDDKIEEERRGMPERWFDQEFMANFLSSEGSVFHNVRDRVAPAPGDGKRPYIAGVDLAKRTDFSVFTIFDSAGRMVAIERMNSVSYELQAERLITLLAHWTVKKVVVEQNGPGDPFLDMLSIALHDRRKEFSASCELIPFQTTATSKRAMIDALSIAFERGLITILPDEDLINEFEAYEMAQTKSGNISFSAPEGGWDDRVMSVALAWTEISAQAKRSGIIYPKSKHLVTSKFRFSEQGTLRGGVLGRIDT
jgi:hypothetical protein